MADYQAGHVKRDPATGASAIRTVFPEVGPLIQHAWLVATVDSGAVSKTTADVHLWDDIYDPNTV
jgi:hypothetical protein